MSKKNNVNPDYYKQKGRDRINEDIVGGKGAPSASKPRGKPPAIGRSTAPGRQTDRAARNRETENPT